MLVVDDHALVRSRVTAILSQACDVVGVAADLAVKAGFGARSTLLKNLVRDPSPPNSMLVALVPRNEQEAAFEHLTENLAGDRDVLLGAALC